MSELWTSLRAAFTHNLGYKLVALLIALVMWVMVQSEHRVEERVRAKVAWVLPDGLSLVEAPIEQATLTVEGIQALVRTLPQRELKVTVDLANAREGDVSVDLSQLKVDGLPSGLRVKGVSPAQLRVQLDRRLKRKVAVSASATGTVAPGFRVVSTRVEPVRVDLEGAASVLRGLEAVLTDDVDLSGLREDAEVEVTLALKKGVRLANTSQRVVVHVDLEPIVEEKSFSAVPVLVRDAAYTAPLASVAVVLAGPGAALAQLSPDKVSVMVHVPEGYSGGTGEAQRGERAGPWFEVTHNAGDDVKVVSVTPNRIPFAPKE